MLNVYSLICEVETDALTDDVSSHALQLEVEIQQDCYIAKLLCEEGECVVPGAPIAICCDEIDELEAAKVVADKIALHVDVYDQSVYDLAGFQSYTKAVHPK